MASKADRPSRALREDRKGILLPNQSEESLGEGVGHVAGIYIRGGGRSLQASGRNVESRTYAVYEMSK